MGPIVGQTSTAGHYEELDSFYRDLWGDHLHHGVFRSGSETVSEAVEELVREVADRARISTGDRVCDVGCGYGATDRWLVRERQAVVTGLTISPAQHRYAVEVTEGSNPRYLLRDWLDNRLPTGAFDAVIAIESTSHMPDPERVFAESARVLRSGGRMVVCAWHASDHPSWWMRRWLLDPIRREGRLERLPSSPELRKSIQSAGLEVVDVQDLTRSVRRTWTICLRRLGRALLRRPEYRAYLSSARHEERVFARAMLRIWIAYRAGAMRYLVWTLRCGDQHAPVDDSQTRPTSVRGEASSERSGAHTDLG